MNYNERILLENYILQEIISLDEEKLNEISVKNAARNSVIAAGLYLAAQKGYKISTTDNNKPAAEQSQEQEDEAIPKNYDEKLYRYYIENPIALSDQVKKLDEKEPDNPIVSLLSDLFISGEGEAEYDGARIDADDAERYARHDLEKYARVQQEIDAASEKYSFFESLTPELLQQIHDGDPEAKVPEDVINAFSDDDFLVEYFDDMLNRDMTIGDTVNPESAAKHIVDILSSKDRNIDNVRAVSSIADDFLMAGDFISNSEYLPSLLNRYENIAEKPGERNRMINMIIPSLQDFVYQNEDN